MITGALMLPPIEIGHHRGVDHAQAFDADARADRRRPPPCRRCRPHPAGADRVVHGDPRRADMRVELGVGARRRRARVSPRRTARAAAAADVARPCGCRRACARQSFVGGEKVLVDARAASRGSAEASSTRPRLSGRSSMRAAGEAVGERGLNGGRYGDAASSAPHPEQQLDVRHRLLRPLLRNAMTPPGRSVAKPVPNT